MPRILIGTKNPHKQKKLGEMVDLPFQAHIAENHPDFEETGDSFEEIARDKALQYARWFGGLAISTDGGAVIPALSAEEWEPLRTRRFGESDKERIARLLQLMADKENRTVEWHEAVAIASPEKVLFSKTARAMDGVIDRTFNPEFYRDGIWLCSLTSFPRFGGRNFFELTEEEQAMTEDSWSELKKSVQEFLREASL
jgi:XTP/dITP diphosphohydrolase